MSTLHLRICIVSTVAALTLAVTATSQGAVDTEMSGLVPVTSSSTGVHHMSAASGHRHMAHSSGRHHHRSAHHRHAAHR